MEQTSPGLTQDHVVCCWGCSRLILVPYVAQSMPAEVFKCGWCEAINSLQQQPLINLQTHHTQQWQQHNNIPQQQQYAPSQAPMQPHDYYTQQQHQWQQQQHLQPGVWQGGSRVQPAAATLSSSSSLPYSGNSRARRPWQRAWTGCTWALRWCAVAMVLLLITSMAGCGILTLLPLLCTTWPTYAPNLLVAVLLLLEICFNYAAAVAQHAGRVSDHTSPPPARSPDGYVPQGSLQHWSWCMHCQAAKPPQAHHCRTCRSCVVNMDHHCTMLNNCVGAGNLRPFLLFLMWTLIAASYILCMCSLLVWQHRQEVMATVAAGRGGPLGLQQGAVVRPVAAASPGAGAARSTNTSSSSSSSGDELASQQAVTGLAAGPSELWLFAATGVFVLVLQESSSWMLAAYYLVAVALGILITLGLLLGSQLYYLGLGVSYIDHLKAGQAAHTPLGHWSGRAWGRWCEVVGVEQLGLLQAVIVPHWHVASASAAKKWR